MCRYAKLTSEEPLTLTHLTLNITRCAYVYIHITCTWHKYIYLILMHSVLMLYFIVVIYTIYCWHICSLLAKYEGAGAAQPAVTTGRR